MKILLTIILTTIVVLFALQNFDHTPIYFFAGKPIHIRLFFVIAISMVVGYLIRYVIGLHREDEIKKKYRILRLQDHKRKNQPDDFDEI